MCAQFVYLNVGRWNATLQATETNVHSTFAYLQICLGAAALPRWVECLIPRHECEMNAFIVTYDENCYM